MNISLDLVSIRAIATDDAQYQEGRVLYETGAVTETAYGKQGSLEIISAKVTDGIRQHRVYISVNSYGKILNYQCNCDSSRIWKGACKHICAVLFAMALEKQDNERQRHMDRSAGSVLSEFENLLHASHNKTIVQMPDDEKISLIPTLICSGYANQGYVYAHLSFHIGNSRKYVLKNICDFIDAVKSSSVISYGKNLAFAHSINNFDPLSQELCKFLREETDNSVNYLNVVYGRRYERIRFERSLALAENGVDKFFDLFKGARVNMELHGEAKTALFTENEDDCPALYKLAESGGGVTLSSDKRHPILAGGSFDYLVTDTALYRISHEKASVINAIGNQLRPEHEYSIHFGKPHIGRFVNFILPQLKRRNLADTGNLDAKYDVRDLAKKVYLDAEDKTVTAKALFFYGEEEINAIGGVKSLFIRDDFAESELKSVLSQLGFTENYKERLYELTDASKIFNFYKIGVTTLNNISEVYATDGFKRKSQKVSYTKTTFGIRLKGDLLQIAPVNCEYSMRELIDIVDAFKAKKKFCRLRDGRFLDLENGDLSEMADFITSLDLEKGEIKEDSVKMHANRAMYIDSLTQDTNSAHFDRDDAFNRVVNDFNKESIKTQKLPEDLDGILRPYQKEGFHWLAQLADYRFGGILADDMGLGKTVQVISLILHCKETSADKPKPSLVVAPTSLIYNWEKEFEKFAPQIVTAVISATTKKRNGEENITAADESADVIITTYDVLKRDLEHFMEYGYKFVVADEAQNIKNPVTQNAKSVKALKAEACFALTGTPIENSLSELWSIFDFVMPGYLRSYGKFSKNYETEITKNKNSEKAVRLKKQISPFILRRVKKDVLSEIPDKIETNLYADMTQEQQRIYAAYYLKAKGELEEMDDKNMMKESRIKILSFITRLRQICCHPGVFIDNYKGGSGKLAAVMETVKNCVESGHRILLFSQFTSILEIVTAEFKKEGIEYFYIDGSTPAKRRSEMTDSFNGGEKQVFLISLKAGGTGLNLTGADVVIHFDPWWNPAVMDQASDRAHRIGQKNVVRVFNVVSKDTIEEKIMALQDKKRDLIDLVITDSANFISKLSSQEIYELFK